MTDIEIRRETPALEHYQTAAVASLADWAQELRAAGQIAEQLCRTPFVPDHFRGKPADAAAAILTGHELGLSPMASLRAIYIINGRPGMYAQTMSALLLSRGHEVWVAAQSDDSVTVCGRRKGSDKVAETTWDMPRCVKAKLTRNAKYQENPQQMMTWRGISEIARQIAPDALHGIAGSVEELEDLPPVRAELSRRLTAADILDDEPQMTTDEAADSLPAARKITDNQHGLLNGLLREVGSGNHDDDLRIISDLIGREVDSTKKLTFTEASSLIERLKTRKKQKDAATPQPVDEGVDEDTDTLLDVN